MAKKRLPEKDIDQLLIHYRSERRRLTFQLDTVRTAILGLKKAKSSMPVVPKAPSTITLPDGTVKRRPGRPRKGEVVVKKAKRGPGRPPKRVHKPRELNKWDNMVMNAITTSDRLLPKGLLLAQARTWAAKQEPRMKAPEVEIFLTRTLQKLSGRKDLLGTHHSGLRRGYHYGLKDWFFNSSGKLRKQHLDKLVLTND